MNDCQLEFEVYWAMRKQGKDFCVRCPQLSGRRREDKLAREFRCVHHGERVKRNNDIFITLVKWIAQVENKQRQPKCFLNTCNAICRTET